GAVPTTCADATIVDAFSGVSSTGPAPLSIFATPSPPSWVNEYSMYASEFGVDFSAAATPSEPLAPCPPGAFQTLSWSKVQSLPAAAVRYLVKLSVVPEESERWKVTIVASGRVAPLFSAVIAGSFHLVIEPEKIFASTDGVKTSPFWFGRL